MLIILPNVFIFSLSHRISHATQSGITRARKLVVLVGTMKAVAIATKRMESKHRITLLKERLGDILPADLAKP